MIKVKDKEELKKIIAERLDDADLNDLDVSGITDMSFLFSFSKFNGDISKWNFNKDVKLEGFMKGINSLRDLNKLKLGKFRRLLDI